jgi:hypothetical protein
MILAPPSRHCAIVLRHSTWFSVPNLHSLTLTLLVPSVKLKEGIESPLSTLTNLTIHLTSIGSPGPAAGHLQTYEVVTLGGKGPHASFFVPGLAEANVREPPRQSIHCRFITL